MEMDDVLFDPLCGTFYPSIDSKGRMSFPGKLRELLGSEFFICLSHEETYLSAFSVEGFKRYCKNIHDRLPGGVGGDILRGVMAGAEKQVPDKQGRIFISQFLRDSVGISGQVVVIGNYDHAEIWNPEAYEASRKAISREEKKAALKGVVL